MQSTDVVIIGGGLAGLACARQLQQAGVDYRLIERDTTLGGRVKSDAVDGFILDRGFQVLLTAYPEAQRQLDYQALDLQHFAPGASVRHRNRFWVMSDPLRDPRHAWATARCPIGTVADKLRILRLRARLARRDVLDLFDGGGRPDRSALQALQDEGFSSEMIQAFWMPLFAGITLEPRLAGSALMRDFVFAMLSRGTAALPAQGIGQITQQLASRLDQISIIVDATVDSIVRVNDDYVVTTNRSQAITARQVVIATDGDTARALTNQIDIHITADAPIAPHGFNSATTVYFSADVAPTDQRWVILDGDQSGPVNNVAVVSNIAPRYAPANKHLIAAQVVGNASPDLIATQVLRQLSSWWGDQVDGWTHLRTDHILYAQPAQPPGALSPHRRAVDLGNGLWICGDHRDQASIQGALASGRRCGTALVAQLGAKSSERNL